MIFKPLAIKVSGKSNLTLFPVIDLSSIFPLSLLLSLLPLRLYRNYRQLWLIHRHDNRIRPVLMIMYTYMVIWTAHLSHLSTMVTQPHRSQIYVRRLHRKKRQLINKLRQKIIQQQQRMRRIAAVAKRDAPLVAFAKSANFLNDSQQAFIQMQLNHAKKNPGPKTKSFTLYLCITFHLRLMFIYEIRSSMPCLVLLWRGSGLMN